MSIKGIGACGSRSKATGEVKLDAIETNLALSETEGLLIQTVAEELENASLISGETSDLTDNLTGEDVTGSSVLKIKNSKLAPMSFILHRSSNNPFYNKRTPLESAIRRRLTMRLTLKPSLKPTK